MKYSQERKQAVLARLAPLHQQVVKDVAAEEGISPVTFYHWRQQARLNGGLFPNDGTDLEGWTARDKFTAVMETAPLNESERAECCRKRELYPHQITVWRRACESATDWAGARCQQQAAVDREVVRSLKCELRRKEKALAPATSRRAGCTAALLTLSKKVRAIWGEGEDA